MWLITTLIAAIIVTALLVIISKPERYKLHQLSLMIWGAGIMILVDHVLGYEGGEFLEMRTDGAITNGVVLGIVMLIPVFILWEIMLLTSKRKESVSKR